MSRRVGCGGLAWLMVLGLCGLVACASKQPPVGVSFDPLEPFPERATWRFDPTANVLPADPRIQALDLGPILEEAISAELSDRGYTPAGSQVADYVVSYELALTTRVRPETSISVASLSLLLRDAKTRRRVWIAFVQTQVDVRRSPEERRARIRAVVAQMLAEFPPVSAENE
jgi:hypothetical protein